MRISALLKTGDEDVPQQVVELIIENTPEYAESTVQIFLQLLVDTMGVDHAVTLEMVSDPGFNRLVMAVGFNELRTNYASKDIVAYNEFVVALLNEVFEDNVLQINMEWLIGSIKFLEALSAIENAQALVSLLSLPFLVGFTQNFSKIKHTNLEEYWDSVFKNVKAGMRHSGLIKKIVIEVCCLIEQCNIASLYILLPIYTEGLKIQHKWTNIKILKSIKNVFKSKLLKAEEKQTIANYFALPEPSRILCYLMFTTPNSIVEETLEVLTYIHEYVLTIPTWKISLYDHLYFKMFNRSEKICILAANFFLKRTVNIKRNEGEVLIEILEFYFKYQPSINYLSSYIKNLWNFEYMHNFQNIFTLLIDQTEIANILTSHFIVAVVKKMLTEIDLYTDNILYLLKKVPLVLNRLQREKHSFAILLEVFVLIDTQLYDPNVIGHIKYFERIIHVLSDTFLNVNHGYKVQENIFYMLDKFIDVEFHDININICDVVHDALQMFEKVFLDWELIAFEVNENNKKNIHESVCNILVIVSNDRFLDMEKIFQVFKIMQKSFLERDYFKQFGESKTRSLAILLVSELFKRIMLFYLQCKEEALQYTSASEFKENAKQFMFFLEKILGKKDQNKYYRKAGYKALISMMLITQKKICYNKNENLRDICIDVSLERYLLVVDFVHYILHSSQKEYGLEDQRDILRHFAELHKYHTGIPAAKELWRIMIHFGYRNDLEEELFEVIKAILKTPNELEGVRFARLFAAIIILLVEKENNGKKIQTILNKYYSLIEEHSVNKNEVASMLIVNLAHYINKQIIVPTSTVRQNRLKVFKFVAPFLSFVTEDDYKEGIKGYLPGVSTYSNLTANESATLKEFETTLFSKTKS